MKLNTINIIINLAKNFYKQFFLLVTLTIIDGLILAGSVISIVPLADYIIDPQLNNPSKITIILTKFFNDFSIGISLYSFAFLFIFLNFFKAIFSIFINYVILKTKYSILVNLTQSLLNNIFSSRWSFFNDLGPGKLFNTLRIELPKVGDMTGRICNIIAIFFQLIFYLIIPIYLNISFTIIVSISFLILMSLNKFLKKSSKDYGKLNTDTANRFAATISETLLGAKFLLSSGLKKFAIKKNISALSKHIDPSIKFALIQSSLEQLIKPISVIIILFAMIITIENNQSLPEYAALFWSFMAIIPLIGKILSNYLSIVNLSASYEQLIFLKEKSVKHKEEFGKIKFDNLKNDIIFKNVKFSYKDKNILNNCNFQILKNKLNIIQGQSGVGKSTIIDLITGLQIPSKGEIKIDEINLNKYHLEEYRKSISVINQEPFLFYDTILNNITLNKTNFEVTKVEKILEFLDAKSFIESLPLGINTFVGDRGTEISGGQRQKIILARNLLKDPKILILDEATNAIDKSSERKIINYLRSITFKMTIILITHQNFEIEKNDNIIKI